MGLLNLFIVEFGLLFFYFMDISSASTESGKLSTLFQTTSPTTTTKSTTKPTTTTVSTDCYSFYHDSKCSRYFFWYDIVGPLFGIIFVVAIVISCCKCIAVAIKRRINTWRGRGASGNRVGANANEDLPPSYDAVGVGSIDLENIVTIDGSIRRKDKIEDKLPTYQEIAEILSKQEQQSFVLEHKTDQVSAPPYQEPTEQSQNTNESLSQVPSVFHDNNAFAIEEEDQLPPPPPYQPCS